jgi:hypothetical protein
MTGQNSWQRSATIGKLRAARGTKKSWSHPFVGIVSGEGAKVWTGQAR